MTAVYVCVHPCGHLPPDHHGRTYACRKPGCRCVRYTPDFKRPVEQSRVLDEILARATRAEIEAAEPEPDTLSTSARLRRVEQERDRFARTASDQLKLRLTAEQERDAIGVKLVQALSAFSVAEELRLKATAELVTARAELEKLRAQVRRGVEYAGALGELSCPDPDVHTANLIVARDGGRYCERCEQEIRRGEAYELQPGTGGLLLHIHCPDTEGNPHA